MMKMSRLAFPIIAVIASLSTAQALAQATQESQQPNAATEDSGAGMQMPGMQMPGIQMPGMDGHMPMMGQSGMMSPQMSNQSQNMCPMMNMMGMMNMTGMAKGGGMMGNAPVDHIDGRLAYLKAEIKITPDQESKWKAFADALKEAAMQKNMMHGQMAAHEKLSWQEHLAKREEHLLARLNSVKAIRQAADPLFSSFTDEQRKQADDLLKGPMSLMR